MQRQPSIIIPLILIAARARPPPLNAVQFLHLLRSRPGEDDATENRLTSSPRSRPTHSTCWHGEARNECKRQGGSGESRRGGENDHLPSLLPHGSQERSRVNEYGFAVCRSLWRRDQEGRAGKRDEKIDMWGNGNLLTPLSELQGTK